jgi:hypothetical protein
MPCAIMWEIARVVACGWRRCVQAISFQKRMHLDLAWLGENVLSERKGISQDAPHELVWWRELVSWCLVCMGLLT